MEAKPKTALRYLWGALKSPEIYDECIIYLDRLWGLHPHNQTPASRAKFNLMYAVFTFHFVLCFLVPFVEWKGIESLGKSEFVSAIYQIVFTAGSYKFKQAQLSVLVSKVKRFWPLDDFQQQFRDSVSPATVLIRRYYTFYRSIITAVIMIYFIFPFLSTERNLFIAWYNLCDIEEETCYRVSMGVQMVNIVVLIGMIFTFDGLFISTILKVYIQLKMIKYRFGNLKIDGDVRGDDEAVMRDVAAIVEHHSFILGFISDMNKFYSGIILSQLVSCTGSLCIALFLLTLHGFPTAFIFVKFILYLLCIFGQIFIYCFGGQLLLDESSSVGDVVYNSSWWAKTQPRLRKSLVLIILRSQTPGILSVGGITHVNLRVYTYVSRTAFSFYTLMNQFYQKSEHEN